MLSCSWKATCTQLAVVAMLLVAGLLWTSEAAAYEQYSVNNDATNCRGCHGDFRDALYVSPVDGVPWGDDPHDIHRNVMLTGDCDTCHSGSSKFPVLTSSSNGGAGLSAISCMGCHGREEDLGHDDTSPGRGAGLRQHHTRAGVADCTDCHADANPAYYTPVGENVAPPFYFTPDASHTGKPTDPCSPKGEEDYAGGSLGLDNDGDLSFDGSDPDCVPEPTASLLGLTAIGMLGALTRSRRQSGRSCRL